MFARMKCLNCGAEASGKFCSSCGSALEGTCASCGAPLLPGVRFCNKCGRAASRASGRGGRISTNAAAGSNLPWYLLAGALVVIVAQLAFPLLKGDRSADLPAEAPLMRMGSGAGTPPPLTGTPREQADRLFNRIMTTHDQGDTASARFFATMGIQAYQLAEPLDADGLYHLALIHNVAGDYTTGQAAAERILATNPSHLLGLAAAAEAAQRLGDQTAARNYHQRFVAAYDAERARGLPEYQDHAGILPQHLATARRAVGS
jgi:hypothetical protein